MIIKGNIVDILNREIFFAEVSIEGGTIQSIVKMDGSSQNYLLPGFVDAHVHIESSMLVPSEFARMAVVHGTVATVSDPHEIANVMGLPGVEFMLDSGARVPFKFNFGAPSCVPATTFETSGASLGLDEVQQLLEKPEIKYLAEMMNYPGVLFEEPEVMAKIAASIKLGKPIDGHAPGLRGPEAKKYIEAGISTDHECTSYEEAKEKLEYGMKILIREGSAAKNFEALIPLLADYPEKIMFCSDDKHPDDLLLGHINSLVARALKKGHKLFDVLHAACVNPVLHYGLEVGLLRPGDPADFIVTDELSTFKIKSCYINGHLVASNGQCQIPYVESKLINNFDTSLKKSEDFAVPAKGKSIKVIKALDGEIVTESFTTEARIEKGMVVSDLQRDLLKLAVVNRYEDAKPSMAFIQNFSLKKGALASCVAHDSHNIVAVGTSDEMICRAVNLIIKNKGGISAVSDEQQAVLPLPIGGIMSAEEGPKLAQQYARIDHLAKTHLACRLKAPFMTLSFMALLVIPQLKLSDRGLFDGKSFNFCSLFVD